MKPGLIWKEFKEFAVRGNVVDMAVGIVIGAAFTTVVQSLVTDLFSPPLGLLTGGIDFSDAFIVISGGTPPPPYATLKAAESAGAVVLKIGSFLNNVISFLLVSFVVFLLVKYVNRLKRPKDVPGPVVPAQKKCPFCFQEIAIEAKRCPYCTSDLAEQE